MTSLATFPSFSGSEFLQYFALFYGCDELSVEDAALLNVPTQLDSPVSQIHALKDIGNGLFRQQLFGEAGGCYDTASRLLYVALKKTNELDINSITSLAVSLSLNLAACANKLQGFEEALIYCSMVLIFFPHNVKALFRKAVALKKLNRFSEALTILDEASLAEPHNKDIIHELEDVRQSLAVNKNGKRVIIDSMNTPDVRARKVSVSPPQRQVVGSPPHCEIADMMELMEEVHCASSQLGADCEEMAPSECVHVTSPVVPMDSRSSSVPFQSMYEPAVSQPSSSTNSKSSHLRFMDMKRPHNALTLSSQDYNTLLHGKNLGFYHPRPMSYMRVRTLTSKTIQTGTPHEVISGTAEVPTTSPLPENRFVPLSETVELVREEVIEVALKSDEDNVIQEEVNLHAARKKQISLHSAQVSKVSAFPFQFVAGKDNNYNPTRSCRRRGAYSYHRRHVTQASIHMKEESSAAVDFSFCFCRYTKECVGVTRAKRTGTDLFHFDELYLPYKKRRLTFSISCSCNISSVCWLSGSLRNSAFRGFVL